MDQNAVILSDVRTQTRLRVRRGDIWYISPGTTVGSEQHSGRPAVVVSSDAANAHSMTVEVVYFTTQPKRDMPTHVTIFGYKYPFFQVCVPWLFSKIVFIFSFLLW